MFCAFGCASGDCPKLVTSRLGKYKAQTSEVTNRNEVTSEGTNRKDGRFKGLNLMSCSQVNSRENWNKVK